MGEKLNEKQIAALRWADVSPYRRWSGVMKLGCLSYATMNAMLRRGYIEHVGMKVMDCFRITPAGRAALPPSEDPTHE